MIAKTVPFSPLRPGIVVMRSTLDAPFKLKWPELQPEIATRITSEIERSFTSMVPVPKNKPLQHNSKGAKPLDSSLLVTVKKEPGLEDSERKQACTTGPCQEDLQSTPALYNAAKRAQVVAGITVMGKLLERHMLRLGFVSAFAPPLMLQNILMLAATRGVPCVCLPDLTNVAPLVGMENTLAIGIKKLTHREEDYFSDFVSTVSALAPRISIPWFSVQAQQPETSSLVSNGGAIQNEPIPTDTSAATSPVIRKHRRKTRSRRRTPYQRYQYAARYSVPPCITTTPVQYQQYRNPRASSQYNTPVHHQQYRNYPPSCSYSIPVEHRQSINPPASSQNEPCSQFGIRNEGMNVTATESGRPNLAPSCLIPFPVQSNMSIKMEGEIMPVKPCIDSATAQTNSVVVKSEAPNLQSCSMEPRYPPNMAVEFIPEEPCSNSVVIKTETPSLAPSSGVQNQPSYQMHSGEIYSEKELKPVEPPSVFVPGAKNKAVHAPNKVFRKRGKRGPRKGFQRFLTEAQCRGYTLIRNNYVPLQTKRWPVRRKQ